jgi:hypothetical protein
VSYVITYKPQGGRTLAISDLDSSEKEVTAWCKALAATMDKVVLHSLAEDGLLTPVDAWVRYGRGARNIGIGAPERAAVAVRQTEAAQAQEAAPAPTKRARKAAPAKVTEPETPEPETPAEDVAEEMPEVEASGDDTEQHTYEAYCVKCKEKRAFVGHVVEMSNGSKAAQGTCPVCSTKVSRMVKRDTPVDDWSDEDEKPVIAEETAKDEQPEPPSVEFSHEDVPAELRDKQPANAPAKKAPAKKAPAKKAAPAKKTAAAKKAAPAKATAKANDDDHKVKCFKCGSEVGVMNRAGLMIMKEHDDPAKGYRCGGSNVEVQNA